MAVSFEERLKKAKALDAAARTSGLESKTADSKLKAQGQSILPAGSTVSYTNVTTPSKLSVTKEALEAARINEQKAVAAANQYVTDNMGWLDMKDPAELEALNSAAKAATAERERLEREYISLPGAYEDKFEGIGDTGKAFATVISKPFLAADVAAETVKAAANGEKVDNTSLASLKYQELNKAREDALSETSGFGRTLANAGLSIADNLYSRLLGLGSNVGTGLIMGATASADKMNELNQQGEDAGRSLVRGALSGAIEGATEALPIGTLANMIKSGGKGIVKNLLTQGGVEATEEGISYVANYIADKAFKDPNAKFDWNELKESVVSGGLSGLFFGLGGTVLGKGNTQTTANTENRPTTPTNDVNPTTATSEQKTAPNAVNGAEAEDYYFDPSEENTSWRERMYSENGKTYIQSQDRQRMYEVPSQKEINYAVNEDGTVVLNDDVIGRLSPKDYRDFTKAYAELNLVTKFDEGLNVTSAKPVTVKSTGGNVIITQTGINDFAKKIRGTGLKNRDNVSSVLLLDKLIENSVPVSSSGNNHSESGNPFTYYKSKLKVGNTNYDVTLHIKNVPTDDRYYYHSLDKVDINKTQQKNVAPTYGNSVNDATYQTEVGTTTSGDIIAPEGAVVNNGDTESVGAAPAGFDPYSNMINQYGIIPEGENPARMVDLPKSTTGEDRVSYAARTVMEAQATSDAMLGDIANAVLSGELSHEVNTDAAAMERARATIEDKGWQGALENFHQMARKGVVSKDAVALGQVLLNNAMNGGDAKTTIDILTDYASMSTTAAQSLQAQRMLKKLTPEGQLYGIQRSVKNLQEELTERYKDKAPKLKIPQNLVQNFLDAQDQDARDAAAVEIYKNIASQVPSTWMDKWNAWRYMSMLTNPRTHVRNIVGNLGFAPVRMVKDAIATTLESGINLVAPNMQRTKAALNVANANDRALISAAFKDVANVQEQLLGAGKYAESGNSVIEENRRIFNNPILELVRKGNSAAMEKEDSWFSSPAYAGALAGYLKANGVTAEAFTNGTVDASLMDDARSYAIKEAQKATYRDHNAFSDFISKLHYKGDNKVAKAADTLVEGVLPFRRTPANILVRGLEYSPAGLFKGLTYDLVQVARGNKTAAEAIDGISAGLTGTGLLALGSYLASQGLLSGGDTGEEERDAMADLTGSQNYALSIGGKNYTLDWLAPEALPLFVGVELFNTISDNTGEGITLDNALSALQRITDPMLEMSMLSGVQDLIDTVQYAESGTLIKVIANAAVSYLTQAIPTLFGQIERSTESQRESTFIDRNSGIPRDIQYTIGKAANKLPGEFQQIPYIDAWGRTEETGNSVERILNNFLNPSYVSEENTTKTDKEINRLIEAGFTGVAPDRVSQSKKVDGEYMDAKQYTEYATVKGQTSFDLVSDMILSTVYKGMTDEEKAESIAKAYSYAGHVAAEEITNGKHESEKYVELAQDAQKDLGLSEAEYLLYYMKYGSDVMNSDALRDAYNAGIAIETFIGYKEDTKGLKADKDANGKTIDGSKKAKIISEIEKLDIPDDAKDFLYEAAGYSASGLKDTPWH